MVLGVAFAAGLLLVARQTRRIGRVMEAVDQISRGDLKRRLADGGRDEFGRLAKLVDAMLDDVERLMHEVKGTCDSIAHDLRAPLGCARVHLVRYLDEAERAGIEPVERALSDIDTTLTRFAALLRLSEIEARALFEQRPPVSVTALVKKIGEVLDPVATGQGVELRYELAFIPVVYGDEQLLFEAIYNLVENAVKFSRDGGTVTVRTVVSAAEPVLIVRGRGPGIPPGELPVMGRRFFRGSAAAGVPGSGLGLALVQAVARLHRFNLSFADTEPGTEVRFEFRIDPALSATARAGLRVSPGHREAA